jgi:uncharacterized SAM-binding protein YcdF (DUF218 family)
MITVEQHSAIIIFGAAVWTGGTPSPALVRRVESAIRIATENPGAYFIVTGGLGSSPPSEAEVMKRELIKRGVAADLIYTEETAANTLDSVLCVIPIIKALPTRPASIFTVTDTYHQWRCRLLLYLSGISTRHANLLSGYSKNGFVRWAFLYLREILATPKDLVLLAFSRLI